jgi:two-component system LytT family sensor kinase
MTSPAVPARRSRLKPWMIVSAIWLWPAVFNVVQALVGSAFFGQERPELRDLLFAFGDWYGYALFTPAIFWIAGRWPVARPDLARRVAIQFAFALLFCVFWAVGGKILELILALAFQPERVQAAISAAGNNLGATVAKNVFRWVMITIPWGVIVYATTSAMAHAIAYFTAARDREVQMARLNEQLASARFSALQAQVNPHFLFNTLNTIAVLVRDNNRDGAVRIVEQLSEVLRRTLSRNQSSEVSLDDELELVRQYLAIEEARFSDRLRVEWSVAAGLGAAAVPSFAVQHLVENAVRHGIARRADASLVRVVARRDGNALEVMVSDDGPGIGAAVAPPGHGLENTRERLRALYGDRALLMVTPQEPRGTIATLKVPFREITLEAAGVSR